MDQQPAYKINSTVRFKFSILLAFAALTFTSNSAFASVDFNFPPSHQSTYSIEKYGTHVGDMHNELTQHNNQVSYASKTGASGFAALFVKKKVRETSILNWYKGEAGITLRQQSYHLLRDKKHKKNQSISFDWTDKNTVMLNGSYKKRAYQLISDEHVWGRHMLPLLLSGELLSNNNASGNAFHITDKGGLQKYIYTLEKTDNMVFSGKNYPVLKFKIKREGSNRMSYTWLSSAHYYLPLKIEQYKDDELSASMLMTEFKLTQLKATQETTAQTKQEVEQDD